MFGFTKYSVSLNINRMSKSSIDKKSVERAELDDPNDMMINDEWNHDINFPE